MRSPRPRYRVLSLSLGASVLSVAAAALGAGFAMAQWETPAPVGFAAAPEQRVAQMRGPERGRAQDRDATQRGRPRERGPAHEHGVGARESAAEGGHVHGAGAEQLLDVPITTLFPGNKPVRPDIKNPVAGNPEAIQRGMRYFVTFNCVGCHAPNGGGGMGPALSNEFFLYGREPANVLMSIHQGRPNGMPVWAPLLSHEMLWDLVAYIESISQEPATTWGRTISAETMKIEQVPAEYVQTATPLKETEPFSNGQKPKQTR